MANNNNKVSFAVQQTYSGPLPPPSELVKYNDACPNAAERIIAMAEKEQSHRHALEDKELNNRKVISIISMIIALLSLIVLSTLIGYAIHVGNDKIAIVGAIGALSSVIGIFVYKYKDRKIYLHN